MGEGGAPLVFPYRRSIAPTLGVLLGLAIVETLVVHLVVVALWGWPAALILGIIDILAVSMLIGLLRAIGQYPVTIENGVLTMRLGRLRSVALPVATVEGLRASWDAAALKHRDVANLALANYPNIVIDLAEPVQMGRRSVRTIARKLDDPRAFAAALAPLVGAR